MHKSIYVIFSLIPYLQILLISNLPGAELATLGNLIYKHYKKKSYKIMFKLSRNNEIKKQCYFCPDYLSPESSEF